MQSLMRLFEIFTEERNKNLVKQEDVEKALSIVGILYQEKDIIEFPEFITQMKKKEGYVEFNLCFRILGVVIEGTWPYKKSQEYQSFVDLSNIMIYFQDEIEPSEFVDEKLKGKGRKKLISYFKRVVLDLKTDYMEMMRDLIFKFNERLLLLSGDALKPYEEVMSKKTTSNELLAEYKDAEFEEEENEDNYDDY